MGVAGYPHNPATVPSPPLPDNQYISTGERPPSTPPDSSLDSCPPLEYNSHMDTASPEPLPIPTQQPKSSITIETVLREQDRGLSQRDIAAKHGVHRSAVRWLIEKHREEKQEVSEFKSHRADILAQLQSKSIALQTQLIDELREDGNRTALTASQKTGLLIALNSINGTAYDKERLETGQSTQNISAVSRMIDSAVSDMYKPLRNKGVVGSAPHEGASGHSDGEATGPAGEGEAGGPGGTGGN